MSYIVVDFEFNQAFDFENNCPQNPNPRCRFEIIQIGAFKLNKDFKDVDNCNIYVKPKLYTKIHPYVEKITGISIDKLESQEFFPDAYKKFSSFMFDVDSEKILCVWGNSDIKILYRNMEIYNLAKKSLIIKYIDVQKLATEYLKYSKGAIGLKNAVELLELKENGNFHDAYYDAYYTAEIFKKIRPERLPIKIFNSKRVDVKTATSK